MGPHQESGFLVISLLRHLPMGSVLPKGQGNRSHHNQEQGLSGSRWCITSLSRPSHPIQGNYSKSTTITTMVLLHLVRASWARQETKIPQALSQLSNSSRNSSSSRCPVAQFMFLVLPDAPSARSSMWTPSFGHVGTFSMGTASNHGYRRVRGPRCAQSVRHQSPAVSWPSPVSTHRPKCWDSNNNSSSRGASHHSSREQQQWSRRS